jgi:uncharacterized damage-inducible protein DinB
MAESQASEPTLRELFRGKRAHADSVACVEGLTVELASRHVDGFPHSIWQLVFHMNYWMDYELKRIRGERPAYPVHADGSWPSTSAPANEAEWLQVSADFHALIDELSALTKSPDLDRGVENMHASQGSRIYSVSDVLWQTMTHNSYHIGQIAMLRRMLGAWPPQGGGDTW